VADRQWRRHRLAVIGQAAFDAIPKIEGSP